MTLVDTLRGSLTSLQPYTSQQLPRGKYFFKKPQLFILELVPNHCLSLPHKLPQQATVNNMLPGSLQLSAHACVYELTFWFLLARPSKSS